MRKKTIILIFLITMEVLMMTTGCGDNQKLYHEVKMFADKHCQDMNVVDVTLSELTDFDWDEALVYSLLMSSKEIEDALGIEYNRPLDLSSGIIFIKNKQIVYEERFIEEYDGIDPAQSNFSVRACKSKNNPKVRIFSPDDVFECYKYGLTAKE